MCVIMLVNKVRPTEEMVARAWDHNKDGVGAAWRENGEVHWKKGVMELVEAQELCRTLPLPYVVHFRVASCGGVKQSLTHPFLISRDATLELEGRTRGAVLFHNGHWNGWNDRVLEAAIHSNNRVPLGDDWSDTRGMAWMVHIYGPGFMNLLPSQKGVIMTPKHFNIFTGNGWDRINDVWCSNDYFWKGRGYHSHQSYGRMCTKGRCTNRVTGGKDVCESCEKASTITLDKDEPAGKTDVVAVATGGTKRPLARAFTTAEIEGLHRSNKISKSTYKKFKKWTSVLAKAGTTETRQAKAKAQLQEISIRVAEQLLHG